MSFEGQQMQGSAKIMEKINSLTFQKIAHLITAVDCQPTFDGGILINVLGQLKARTRTIKRFLFVDDKPPPVQADLERVHALPWVPSPGRLLQHCSPR